MSELLPDTRAGNLVVWAVAGGALLGWQVITANVSVLPSIAVVARVLRSAWPTRWLLLLGWVWLGWHLFVRTHH